VAEDTWGEVTFDAPELTCEPGRFVNVSPPTGVQGHLMAAG